ncbi:MAG: hypothetical protein HPY71_00370 [Firmicutes bacterium]|nr:hypothetical protein [Bacillota bacterium]
MVIAGLGFLGVRRSLRRAIAVGLIVGTATVIFRSLLPGGYHVPLVLLSYCVSVGLILKVSAKTAIIACFISSFLINLGQVLIISPVLKVLGLSFEDALRSVWLHIGFGWLGDAILFVAAMLVTLRKTTLIRVPESEQLRGADNHGQ